MTIRALIVDDEPLARQSVRRFLQYHADIHVVAECADGQSAVNAILRHQPDLVFLDIQMPEMDGFQVLSRIDAQRPPAIIFVTAYDRYALRAFDASALDYLLKPFGKTRFDKALARARERLGAARDPLDRLPVYENGRILFVQARDIFWIEAAGNYARLHLASRTYDLRETLAALETRLDPKNFLRIHRSAIVNVRFVKEVHPWFHGYHLVVLENGLKLRMSRYQRQVAARLGLPARSAPH